MGIRIINLADNIEYDTSNREGYLQWKSDCWRNVSISFKEAIGDGDLEGVRLALELFEEVKKMFPFQEAQDE